MTLRKSLIRLAHEKPELRADLLPLLQIRDKTASLEAEDSLDQAWGAFQQARQFHLEYMKSFNAQLGKHIEGFEELFSKGEKFLNKGRMELFRGGVTPKKK